MANVLVVEDDAAIRTLIANVLVSAGHDVNQAVDGADGLRAFETSSPDLVITDLAMPNMTGDELIQRILSRDTSAHMPIVVFTALSQHDPRVGLLLQLDNICVLHKPMEVKKIGEVADQMIRETATPFL